MTKQKARTDAGFLLRRPQDFAVAWGGFSADSRRDGALVLQRKGILATPHYRAVTVS
jgi:hypothetical protein